jgi:hypothetical protein
LRALSCALLILQTGQLQVQQKAAVDQVEQLEGAIKVYKAEYAAAIRDTETIKAEMDIVTKKVKFSNTLNSVSLALPYRTGFTSCGPVGVVE